MNLQLSYRAIFRKSLLTLACFTLGLSLSGNVHSLFAQGASEITAVYGRGVHAFFACNRDRADQLFSEVIQAGSRDPRVYYFRGLALLQQGRQYEAEDDFRMGAALEAQDPGRRYAIGTALQRIQGPARQTLERYRREGRLQKYQERRQQNQQRYEQLRSREPDVLHQDAPVLMEDLVLPSVERPAPPEVETGKIEESKPTPAPIAIPTPAPPQEPAPSAPAVAPEMDPFGSPPPQEPTPAEEDPFSEPAKTESKPVPAAEPEDDLFGPADEPTDSEPAVSQPSAPAVEEDLFSDPAPAPAATQPTPAPTAPSPADDLFGAEPTPTPEPAVAESSEEDPFGGPEEAASQTPEATPDETTLDEEETHNEDAEAAADREAAEVAQETDTFVEEPADEADSSGDTSTEGAADESATEEGGMTDETSSESSTEEDDPFGGF